MAITVCIVDDTDDIRTALEEIVSMAEGYELLGGFSSGEEALEDLLDLQPQVVLMDINLGGISGIECVRQLKPKNPDILYMMCTVYEEDEKIFEALSAGASGYILKKTSPDKLLEAISELHEGGAPMSSQIARKVVAAFGVKLSLRIVVLVPCRTGKKKYWNGCQRVCFIKKLLPSFI